MKQLIPTIGLLLISICSFAAIPSLSSNSISPATRSMGLAWKAAQSAHALQDKNDINIVYGGKDISLRPTIINRTTTA